MFNSKYTGQQVEVLLDKVSGSTIGGGGGVSEERFDGLDKATAVAITRIVEQYMTIANAEKTYAKSKDVYTKTEANTKFIDSSELENELIAFMRSDAYHSIHDPQEKAIAAALNSHNDRITVLESGGTGSSNTVTGYDRAYVLRNMTKEDYDALQTKDENTIYFVNGVPAQGGAVDISTLVARIEALEAKLSGMTS